MITGERIVTIPFVPTTQELFDFGFRFQTKNNDMILSFFSLKDCELYYHHERNEFIFEDSGGTDYVLNVNSFEDLEKFIRYFKT